MPHAESVSQQTIMVLSVTVTTTVPQILHDQVTFSHKRTWHCVLSLTVMVDSNGPVTTAGFAYNTYRFCLYELQVLPATITGLENWTIYLHVNTYIFKDDVME